MKTINNITPLISVWRPFNIKKLLNTAIQKNSTPNDQQKLYRVESMDIGTDDTIAKLYLASYLVSY